MNYKYSDSARWGARRVKIDELREFWGRPAYRVSWTDPKGKKQSAILREDELDD